MSSYKLFTLFPQKLWKTSRSKQILKTCLLCALVILLVASCTYFKKESKKENVTAKNDPKRIENALIDMSEEDVRKRFGEPEMVSKTPDNHIIWTYKPSWKLMPDNKDTLYVEFNEGKVIKVIKKKR